MNRSIDINSVGAVWFDHIEPVFFFQRIFPRKRLLQHEIFQICHNFRDGKLKLEKETLISVKLLHVLYI